MYSLESRTGGTAAGKENGNDVNEAAAGKTFIVSTPISIVCNTIFRASLSPFFPSFSFAIPRYNTAHGTP